MDADFKTMEQYIIISNKLKKLVKSSWRFQPILNHLNTKK